MIVQQERREGARPPRPQHRDHEGPVLVLVAVAALAAPVLLLVAAALGSLGF